MWGVVYAAWEAFGKEWKRSVVVEWKCVLGQDQNIYRLCTDHRGELSL